MLFALAILFQAVDCLLRAYHCLFALMVALLMLLQCSYLFSSETRDKPQEVQTDQHTHFGFDAGRCQQSVAQLLLSLLSFRFCLWQLAAQHV